MVNWNEKCHYGVLRSSATQHGYCASCKHYVMNPNNFPSKCTFEWRE